VKRIIIHAQYIRNMSHLIFQTSGWPSSELSIPVRKKARDSSGLLFSELRTIYVAIVEN